MSNGINSAFLSLLSIHTYSYFLYSENHKQCSQEKNEKACLKKKKKTRYYISLLQGHPFFHILTSLRLGCFTWSLPVKHNCHYLCSKTCRIGVGGLGKKNWKQNGAFLRNVTIIKPLIGEEENVWKTVFQQLWVENLGTLNVRRYN